jgi:hypothetical protein
MRKLMLLAAFTLAACGPQYRTTYEMEPPPTPQGAQCANTCLQMLGQCQRGCQSQQSLCEMINSTKRMVYDDRYPPPVQPMFEQNDCSTTVCRNDCTTSYRVCHTNCGGRVIPHTTCTGKGCPAT